MELDKLFNEGRVVILPCPEGAIVYGFGEKYGWTCTAPLCVNALKPCHVMGGCYSRRFIVKPLSFDITILKDFGKSVFLTKEEALNALNKFN